SRAARDQQRAAPDRSLAGECAGSDAPCGASRQPEQSAQETPAGNHNSSIFFSPELCSRAGRSESFALSCGKLRTVDFHGAVCSRNAADDQHLAVLKRGGGMLRTRIAQAAGGRNRRAGGVVELAVSGGTAEETAHNQHLV